jgi:hypothetical protein
MLSSARFVCGVGCLLATAACDRASTQFPAGAGGSGGAGVGGGGGSEMGYGGQESWQVDTGSGGCNASLYAPPIVKSPHVEECTPIDYLSNPPTSGPHYPRWANVQTYDEPPPLGYLVHAMEHGAVLLGYRCPSGCDTEVAAMQAFVDGLADDPSCPPNVRVRLIITPLPSLDVPFAAAAWGHMLKADCFDETLLADFVDAHYASGPEDVCGSGFDPTDPAERVPTDCGQ